MKQIAYPIDAPDIFQKITTELLCSDADRESKNSLLGRLQHSITRGGSEQTANLLKADPWDGSLPLPLHYLLVCMLEVLHGASGENAKEASAYTSSTRASLPSGLFRLGPVPVSSAKGTARRSKCGLPHWVCLVTVHETYARTLVGPIQGSSFTHSLQLAKLDWWCDDPTWTLCRNKRQDRTGTSDKIIICGLSCAYPDRTLSANVSLSSRLLSTCYLQLAS
jgi:hypothetical protein